MDKEICTISIPRNSLDNDYTFYENGKILHYYDDHSWSLNNKEWIISEDISEQEKEKILDKCPVNCLEEIKKILY